MYRRDAMALVEVRIALSCRDPRPGECGKQGARGEWTGKRQELMSSVDRVGPIAARCESDTKSNLGGRFCIFAS